MPNTPFEATRCSSRLKCTFVMQNMKEGHVDWFNVRALGMIVMGTALFIGAIALYVLWRMGLVPLDDNPKENLIGTVVFALFGLLLAVTNWLSVREPRRGYKVTNKPSEVIRR